MPSREHLGRHRAMIAIVGALLLVTLNRASQEILLRAAAPIAAHEECSILAIESTASVTATLIAADESPIAVDDVVTTPEDTGIWIRVLENDLFPTYPVDPDSLSIVSGPSNGSTSFHPTHPWVGYAPAADWHGTDSFVYQICNTNGACDTATVTITVTPVNDAPVAEDDTVTVVENSVDNPIDVLANDYDVDGDALTISAVGAPNQGGTVLNGGTVITYTPAADLTGIEVFTYTVSDGALYDTATVTVTVIPANEALAITSADSTTFVVGAAGVFTVTATGVPTPTITQERTLPDGITFVDNQDGTATLSGTPAAGTGGQYPLTFTASNGVSPDATQDFVLTVNDLPVPHPEIHYAYLALVARRFAVGPDLVVRSLTATANQVTVKIANQGNAPARDAFWVDVYINPHTVPTAVNQPWHESASQGLVWAVNGEALSALVPGGEVTLSVGDAYYAADYSEVSWPIPAGTVFYAQVDSYNADTTYGAVLETHEIAGGPYNNIGGPFISASTVGIEPATGSRQELSLKELPSRLQPTGSP